MTAVEQASTAVPFAVVRRGFDPVQVTEHLDRVDVEMKIVLADRAAATDQVTQLGQQLDATRRDLDAARGEVERLRDEIRVMSGPPDSVDRMSERLQVMLRLAQDEFGEMRAAAGAYVVEIIGALRQEAGHPVDAAAPHPGDDGSGRRDPDVGREIDRLRREAAEERARLDEAAAVKRAEVDEEFRRVLALRCREALAQLTTIQAEALRTGRGLLDVADEQATARLAGANETARRIVDEAQREVDDLHALRERLTHQLDATRELLDRALPEAPAPAPVEHNGAGPGATG